MSKTAKTTLRSIFAIVAGFLTDAFLSVATDALLEALGVFPPQEKGLFVPWMLLLALFYRTVYAILAGFVVAKLAPRNLMKHVIVLATIGTAFAVLGLVATWGKGLGPAWYPIWLALLSFPSVWFGGKLKR